MAAAERSERRGHPGPKGGRPKRLEPTAQHLRIMLMHGARWTDSLIANELGISRQAVGQAVRRWKEWADA